MHSLWLLVVVLMLLQAVCTSAGSSCTGQEEVEWTVKESGSATTHASSACYFYADSGLSVIDSSTHEQCGKLSRDDAFSIKGCDAAQWTAASVAKQFGGHSTVMLGDRYAHLHAVELACAIHKLGDFEYDGKSDSAIHLTNGEEVVDKFPKEAKMVCYAFHDIMAKTEDAFKICHVNMPQFEAFTESNFRSYEYLFVRLFEGVVAGNLLTPSDVLVLNPGFSQLTLRAGWISMDVIAGEFVYFLDALERLREDERVQLPRIIWRETSPNFYPPAEDDVEQHMLTGLGLGLHPTMWRYVQPKWMYDSPPSATACVARGVYNLNFGNVGINERAAEFGLPVMHVWDASLLRHAHAPGREKASGKWNCHDLCGPHSAEMQLWNVLLLDLLERS
jgi:hypothetical protein